VAAWAALPAQPAPADRSFHRDGIIVPVAATKSNNWAGYNQGILEKGAPFTSISGTWTVPRATQHAKHRAEPSSAWIGFGGGCPDPSCTAPSATLIQEGTEQDVGRLGKAHYSAWWELITAPSVRISGFAVHPGNRIHASIVETPAGSNVWAMSMRNLTTGKRWSQIVPSTSSHDTAEWIVETPLTFGTGGAGLANMPNLSRVHFDRARVNGARAGLVRSQEMQLVDSKDRPVATPSRPDAENDGFNVCTYAARCPAP
jgi:peptidase A4-like protein